MAFMAKWTFLEYQGVLLLLEKVSALFSQLDTIRFVFKYTSTIYSMEVC
jgi:hypothetical protein